MMIIKDPLLFFSWKFFTQKRNFMREEKNKLSAFDSRKARRIDSEPETAILCNRIFIRSNASLT